MLFPKKVKFRKWQKQRKHPEKTGVASRGIDIDFGSHGMKSVDYGRIRSFQIEAARKIISRTIGKTGRMWIRVFPDRPYTEKPPEVGMGKGKGDPQGYEFEVTPGRVLFEVDGVTEEVAREALRKGAAKLPVAIKIVAR
ncbi:MAG: 50S ribosomal protein L16 [Candidatus Campbellbacteria bacterium]|nr:50S ribosomal protein L16 [Candidatus Campbellbacteria bacterium]